MSLIFALMSKSVTSPFSDIDIRANIKDISRATAEHSDHLYSMAEALKDGNFVSTKYQTRSEVFPRPHVIGLGFRVR